MGKQWVHHSRHFTTVAIRFAPFIGSAMHADIGKVVKLNASR